MEQPYSKTGFGMFSKSISNAIYCINCHKSKHALSQAKQRSIEESIACFVIDLCNLCMGSRVHIKSVAGDLCIIIKKLCTFCAEEDCFIQQNHKADTSLPLDDLLQLLEEVFDALLTVLGPRAGLTPAQIFQAETDMHALIATIEGIEHRDIEAQTGAEHIVRELMQLLSDFGINPEFPTSDTPTALDAALDALRGALDGALEVYGPRYGLDPYTVSRIEADLAEIEEHVKDIEHGRTPVTDGLVIIVDDVFNMLRDFGVPVLPIESAVGLAEKSAYLRQQLETILRVSHSRRSSPSEPSLVQIRKLEFDLVALSGGRDGVTLFEVVYDMNMVVRQFVGLLN